MSLPNKRRKKSELLLIEIAQLATPKFKPKTFSEVNDLVWRAFEIGKEYYAERLMEVRRKVK